MKLPTQASPVRRFAVQDYSNVQETLEEAANKTNSLELKLKPKKENDSSSPFKDFKEILKEVSSGGSITQQTPNATHEPSDDIQKYPSDTGLWTKLEDKEATIQEDLNAVEIKYGRRLFKILVNLFSLVFIALLV